MPIVQTVLGPMFGAILGMRHAFEPDHLAAVSTLVSEERGSRKAALLGVAWGLGHTTALLTVGLVLAVLRLEMPPRASEIFEFGVALMLIALGVRAMRKALRQGREGPPIVHQHGGAVHRHGGSAAHVHVGRWTLAKQPLIVGLVHGLAGSGALSVLVLATLPSTLARFAYMGLFGLGSTIGMATLSGFLGWPLARMSHQQNTARWVVGSVGAMSTVLGILWGYPIVTNWL